MATTPSSPQMDQGISILIADDEPVTRRLFKSYLNKSGFDVTTAEDGADALQRMRPDIMVAVLDLNMPGMGGQECLKLIRERFPQTEVLIVTGVGQIKDAVAALKAGACEFVTKPCEAEDLVAHVQQALRTARLSRENHQLRSAVTQLVPTSKFAANTEAAQQLMERAAKLAQLESTVLLTGESGTGKTTIARMIHEHGNRASKPFVAVNCASLPRDLIEAELFGHVKGAFTGAVEERIGRAELADGGTLFLDEIGDLPLELQPKLLTFLQERTLQRIGSNKEVRVDVRLIAATHQDLEQMCDDRRFRPDLFYRLNVLHIEVPSVRQRRGDIPDLARTILDRIAQQRGCGKISIDDDAGQLLQQHDWPGNIRELENALERASAFCTEGRIRKSDVEIVPKSLSNLPVGEPNVSTAGLTLKEIEKRALVAAIEANGGNKAMAARELGISEKSIYNKLKRFGLFEKQVRATS